ncbi:hypothetical protein HYU45_02575 [Candidatus Daviesbacteria bacterium]|nr:hypothetical protein [Candidatus Daviesbacteria bacterium]
MERTANAILQTERADVKIRGPVITEILKDSLAATALVQDKPFTDEDVVKTRLAILLVAPYAHLRVFPSYWEHIVYSSIIARHIAQNVGSDQLYPYEAEVLQFFDDVGSLVIPHRYFRKNVVNRLFDRNIGVRQNLEAKHPPIPQILGRGKVVISINDLTLPQIILDLADNLGKLNPDGAPFSIAQKKRYNETQLRRYAGGIFASERFGLRALAEKGKQKLAIDLVFDEIEFLRMRYGITIEEICKDAFEEFSLQNNQRYLRNLNEAQETLDPKVDETLKRPPVETVVFDAGGVLFQDADSALFKGLASFFSQAYEDVILAMNDLNPEAFGNKISEEEYLRRFWDKMGQPYPENLDQARAPFRQPEIYNPINGMQDLVRSLAQNPNIQLYVLSDCIHPVATTVFNWIAKEYPQIPPDHILISSRINTAKIETNSPAFQILLKRLSNPNPQSVLFIDDNPVYTTTARARYGLRSIHFRENDPARLDEELKRAKLI